MNRIFEPRKYVTVPDGTQVSAFLNATDVTQEDVPWGTLGDLSIAAGRVAPKSHSWVHVHHAVTQVTYLVSGTLTVRMKDASGKEPYDLPLQAGQATVAQPGTLFQLRNDSDGFAEVLYVVSPSYVYEQENDHLRYDDATLVAKTWEEIAAARYELPALKVSAYEARARRQESLRRIARRKGIIARSLASEPVRSVEMQCGESAPDGSEVRRLTTGERGGFAHHALGAGKSSVPVAHRTVEQLLYVLEGTGEIWRSRPGEPSRTDRLGSGDSFRIPVGTTYQLRASNGGDLRLLVATIPPWPGTQEAIPGDGGVGGQASPSPR